VSVPRLRLRGCCFGTLPCCRAGAAACRASLLRPWAPCSTPVCVRVCVCGWVWCAMCAEGVMKCDTRLPHTLLRLRHAPQGDLLHRRLQPLEPPARAGPRQDAATRRQRPPQQGACWWVLWMLLRLRCTLRVHLPLQAGVPSHHSVSIFITLHHPSITPSSHISHTISRNTGALHGAQGRVPAGLCVQQHAHGRRHLRQQGRL
jgi:hypothetical protein